jgi:hypothetical protein
MCEENSRPEPFTIQPLTRVTGGNHSGLTTVPSSFGSNDGNKTSNRSSPDN